MATIRPTAEWDHIQNLDSFFTRLYRCDPRGWLSLSATHTRRANSVDLNARMRYLSPWRIAHTR